MSDGITPISAVSKDACSGHIGWLLTEIPQITGVMISSVDGFEQVCSLSGGMSAPKLAAITSSMMSLGEVLSVEGQAGQSQSLIIEGSDGSILLISIPGPRREYVLTVLGGNGAPIGHLRWAAKECSERIARELAGS